MHGLIAIGDGTRGDRGETVTHSLFSK